MSLLRTITLLLAFIVTFCAYASTGDGKMQAYFAGLAKTGCLDLLLGKSIADVVKDEIVFPHETRFYLDASLWGTNQTLVKMISNYSGYDIAHTSFGPVYEAGLRFEITVDDKLVAMKGGKSVLAWVLHEPLADIRFVSDRKLHLGPSDTTGYLSLIGWTHTDYYHFDGDKLKKIELSEYENIEEIRALDFDRLTRIYDIRAEPILAVFATDNSGKLTVRTNRQFTFQRYASELLKAAGMKVDLDLLSRDRAYQEKIAEEFNRLGLRASVDIRTFGAAEQADLISIARFRETYKAQSLLKVSLGKLAEAIIDSIKTCPSGEVVLQTNGFPKPLLRLAADALRSDAALRTFFAELVNESQSLVRLSPLEASKYDKFAGFTSVLSNGCGGYGIRFEPSSVQREYFISFDNFSASSH